MTKFEMNGVTKQEQAYSISFAKRCFNYSCETCATRGLDSHRHGCSRCPIMEAYTKAIEEIASGKRKTPDYTPTNYGATKFHNNGGHQVLVLRCDSCKNMTININTKEDK